MFNSVSRTYCHVTAIFIRILVCDTLTVLRCDRMPFFTRGQGKIFLDLRWEMFIGEGRVPFDTVVPFISRLPSPSDVFPAKIQNSSTTFVVERKARLLFERRESRYFRRSFHSCPGGSCNLYEARSSQKSRFFIMKIFCPHIRSMNLKANSG